MGFFRRTGTFVIGAAIGAAGGLLASRVLAPGSGAETRHNVEVWKDTITSAGEDAKVQKERELELLYRASIDDQSALHEQHSDPTI